MPKNNKGFTVIELIMSFMFTSILAISLFSVVLNYRNKEMDNKIETELLDFKTNLTIDIEKDIQKYGLSTIEYCINPDPESTNRLDKCIKLNFNNGTSKEFKIKEEVKIDNISGQDFQYKVPYITYGGIKYEIPDAANVDVRGDYLLEYTTENDDLETNTPLYKIRVSLVHSDLDADMDISINANGTHKFDNIGEGPHNQYTKGDFVRVQLNGSTQLNFVVLENSGTYNENVILLYNDSSLGNVKFNNSRNSGNKYNNSTIKTRIDNLANSWTNASEVRLISAEEIAYVANLSPSLMIVDIPQLSFSGNPPSWLSEKNSVSTSYWTSTAKSLSGDDNGKKVWYVDGNNRMLRDAYVDQELELRPVIKVKKVYCYKID